MNERSEYTPPSNHIGENTLKRSSSPEMIHQFGYNRSNVPASMRPQSLIRDFICEFMGTCTLVLFGLGSIAQAVLTRGQFGSWSTIPFGWGVAVFLGAIVCGKSGGHMNPAVTVAMAIYRKFPLRKLPVYWLAQFLGSLVAAALIWGNFQQAIREFESSPSLTVPPAVNATAGIFATYPAPYLTKSAQFFSEILASGILVFFIMSITDENNPMWLAKKTPFGLFFIFYGITSCFGFETGFAINPARDFAPRLLTAMLGYGKEVWTAQGHYFLVPMFAPFIGAIFGGFFYDLLLYSGNGSAFREIIDSVLFRKSPEKKRNRMQYNSNDESNV